MKVVNHHIERHTEINNNLGLEPALCKANLIFVTEFEQEVQKVGQP